MYRPVNSGNMSRLSGIFPLIMRDDHNRGAPRTRTGHWTAIEQKTTAPASQRSHHSAGAASESTGGTSFGASR